MSIITNLCKKDVEGYDRCKIYLITTLSWNWIREELKEQKGNRWKIKKIWNKYGEGKRWGENGTNKENMGGFETRIYLKAYKFKRENKL